MIGDELFDQILRSPEPLWELRGALRLLIAQGHDRQALLAHLEAFRATLWDAERSDQEVDVIDDAIAHLIGYCSPHLQL
jgi:hypothetical protein